MESAIFFARGGHLRPVIKLSGVFDSSDTIILVNHFKQCDDSFDLMTVIPETRCTDYF